MIAFLFNSVKSERAVGLANFLESNGINIYSPRSNMFFQRVEVKQTFGFLLLAFPMFVKKLSGRSFSYVDEGLCQYYEDCLKTARALLMIICIYIYIDEDYSDALTVPSTVEILGAYIYNPFVEIEKYKSCLSPGMVIQGYKGTEAERYANE